MRQYRTVLTAADILASKDLIVSPISEMVTAMTLAQVKAAQVNAQTPGSLDQLRSSAVTVVQSALLPILQAKSATERGDQLLFGEFTPTVSKLDQVLDTFDLYCSNDTQQCAITLTNKEISDTLKLNNFVLATDSLTKAQAQATDMAKQLEAPKVQELLTENLPVVLVFSAQNVKTGSSPEATTYDGRIALYNFGPVALTPQDTVVFESKKLKASNFTPGLARIDTQVGKFALILPEWQKELATIYKASDTPFVFGFSGSGSPVIDDVYACRIGRHKCIVLPDDKTIPVPETNATEIRSWTKFVASQKALADTPQTAPQTPAEPPTPTPEPSPSAHADMLLRTSLVWDTGFNGELVLTNTTDQDWSGWSMSFDLPDGMTNMTGWNTYKLTLNGRRATLDNEFWDEVRNINAGSALTLGFGGEGVLQAAGTNCTVSYTIKATGVTVSNQPCTTRF